MKVKVSVRTYIDLNIKIINSKFTTDLYDKREACNFKIVNYPHMDSNIPLKPAYRVFISQLIRYLRVCGYYQHFVYRNITILNVPVVKTPVEMMCSFCLRVSLRSNKAGADNHHHNHCYYSDSGYYGGTGRTTTNMI